MLAPNPDDGIVTRQREEALDIYESSLQDEKRRQEELEEQEALALLGDDFEDESKQDEWGEYDEVTSWRATLSQCTESNGDMQAVFDGHEIVKGVYFGAEACAIDSAARRTYGITHVLAVLSSFEMSFKLEASLEKEGRLMILDREDRPLSDLLNVFDSAVGFIQKVLDGGGRVCVISQEGRSRSVAVCLAFLVKSFGMTLRSAFDLAKTHDPEVSMNRGFWQQLLVYEEHIRGCKSISQDELPGVEAQGLKAIVEKYRTRDKLERKKSIDQFHEKQKRQIEEALMMGPNDENSSSSLQMQVEVPSVKNASTLTPSPLSPTTATGIASMTIGSTPSKRRAFDWPAEPDSFGQRNKSPRNSVDHGSPTF